MDRDLLASARSGRSRKGQTYLIKHLEGGRLYRSQAIQAKCYDCDGMGETGKCAQNDCPLYPYSSFKE